MPDDTTACVGTQRGTVSSASTPDDATAASTRIRELIADPAGLGGPGCVAGIFRNGRLTDVAASGAADIETRRPIDIDTQFYAASVAKQFTAVALTQLVVQGRVRLDDDIRIYLPEMPLYQRQVTVRMLLSHTAGIRDSLMLLVLNGQMDWSAVSRAEAVSLTLRQSRCSFEAGTRYAYSNGGYLLLSEIIERVSNKPFEDYMAERVLQPLGMTRSHILSGTRPTGANVANGYAVQNGSVRQANDYPLFGGSGGLITTLCDLAKWDHDIDSGHRVWTPALLRLMIEPGRLNDGERATTGTPGNYYAAGLAVNANWFSHGGAANGFKAFFGHGQRDRVGIALLCNRSDILPDALSEQIIRAIDPDLPGDGLRQAPEGSAIPTAALAGNFRSGDLDATYLLRAHSDDVLEVAVLGPDGMMRNELAMKRVAGGVYTAGGLELYADEDCNGFKLSGGRVTMHLTRVEVQ